MNSMFEIQKDHIAKVCHAFNLKSFEAGVHFDADNETSSLVVEYIWAVHVMHFGKKGHFLLSAAQIKTYLKPDRRIQAVLMLPMSNNVDLDTCYEAISIPSDNVMKAMEQTPLIHQLQAAISGDETRFNLYAATHINQVKFTSYGMGEYPSMTSLWQSIFETLQTVRKIYENTEIEDYFRRISHYDYDY